MRVLLAEDHEDSREATRRLLTRAGCSVLAADGYRTAVALAATSDFDVLVTDLHLADGDGRSLYHHLSKNRRLPAVLVTGSATAADEEQRSLEAGFCVHLTKPITFDRLMRAIRQCVDNKRARAVYLHAD